MMTKSPAPHRLVFNLQFAIGIRQFAIVWLVLLALTSTARAAPPLAVPIDEKPFAADLTAVSNEGILTFTADGKPKQLRLADLVCWGTLREPRRGPLLALADGGLLAADVLGADKDRLDVDSELFGRLNLPLDALSGVVFSLPGAGRERERLLGRLAAAAGDSDRLLLENGDELAGTLESIGDKLAKLQTDAGLANVELGRVSAVIFNPRLRGKPESKTPCTWLGFADGSRLHAKSFSVLSLGEGQGARVGETVQFSVLGQNWKSPLKSLAYIQPLSGHALYLSDLKPAEYRHVPYLSITWPYQFDRNALGGDLRAGGRLYLKGIGMHSAARLNYALPPGAKRFQAEVALDDAAGGDGSVRFRVFVDGKEIYASSPVRGEMPPAPIDVDVSAAKRLDLVVDFADRADVQDRADWLNARLVMEAQ